MPDNFDPFFLEGRHRGCPQCPTCLWGRDRDRRDDRRDGRRDDRRGDRRDDRRDDRDRRDRY